MSMVAQVFLFCFGAPELELRYFFNNLLKDYMLSYCLRYCAVI